MKISLKIIALLVLVMLLTFVGFFINLRQQFIHDANDYEKSQLYETVNNISRILDIESADYREVAEQLASTLLTSKNEEKTILNFFDESNARIAFYVSNDFKDGVVYLKQKDSSIVKRPVHFKDYFAPDLTLDKVPQEGHLVFENVNYLVGSAPYSRGKIFVGSSLEFIFPTFFSKSNFKLRLENIPRILDQEWPRDWIVIEKMTNTDIVGRIFFNDLSGRKSTVLVADMTRTQLPKALAYLSRFRTTYIFFALLITCLLYLIIHIIVVRRVLTIKNELEEIKNTTNFTKRLPNKSNDELGQTIEMINSTLSKLNDSYQFAERLTHLSTNAVFTVDKNKLITSWNKRAEEMTGYTAKDIIGKPCSYFSLIPCRDRCALYDPNAVKPVYGKECIIVTKEGKKIQILKNSDYLRDQEGKIIGGIENFEDITHRIKAEKEKESLQQQVFQTSKLASLGTLGAGIAHELNNPLAIVMGYTDVLQGKLEELNQPELLDIVSKIEQNADRMRKIVSHIKEFSRDVSKDDKTLENINDIANSILFFIGRQLMGRNIKIEMNFATNLPLVKVNKVKMQSVIQNLVLNARDELSDLKDWSRKVISLSTGLSADSKHIILRVADTGRGVPANIQDKIFEPFFTTKPTGKGTGLGLSLSYGIIQEHYGTISVTNNLEGGACFVVTIPLEEPKDSTTPKT